MKSILKILAFPFALIYICIISIFGILYDVLWNMTLKHILGGLCEILTGILSDVFKGIFQIPRSFKRWNDGWDRSKYDAKTLAFWALQKYGTNIESAKWILKKDELTEYKKLIKRYPQGYSQYKKEVEEAQKKEEEEKRRREEEKSLIYSMDAREYELYVDSLRTPYKEEEDDNYLDSQYKNSIESTLNDEDPFLTPNP